jgi:membrane protease YdiL (CAAX protease family)
MREAAFETLVRVPFETALAEELIFRGALLGIALDLRSPARAIAFSSLAFGLWHVPPTRQSFDPSTGAIIIATTAAGVGFALLRLRAKSVAAPIVVHAALNMAAYAGVWLTARSTASV